MLTAIAFAAAGRAEAPGAPEPRTRLPELAYRVMGELEDSGPTPVDEIPCRWPLTRMHLRHVVDELIDAGVAEWIGPAGSSERRLALTETGRRVLAVDRWEVAQRR